jgi:hypothetical protein
MLAALEDADETLAMAICSTFGMMGPSALDVLANTIDATDGPYKSRLIHCIEIANRGET